MKVEKVRLGHANNSSSTHSILFKCIDDISNLPSNVGYEEDKEFGWGEFLLQKESNKRNYLGLLVYYSLEDYPVDYRIILANTLTGSDLKSKYDYGDYDVDGHIDHQSRIQLPFYHKYLYGDNYLHTDFLNDFKDILLSSDVSIGGGNDNDISYDWNAEKILFKDLTDIGNDIYTRKEDDWYIIYNKHNGNKFRFTFKDDPKPYIPKSPQLVDLKITDYCPYNCPFCYMGSSKEGEHALPLTIYNILEILAEAEVFEVAIGGGEPTEHPRFSDILYHSYRLGITPNFTTKKISSWIDNEEIVKAINTCCGSFAVSADNRKDIVDVYNWNENNSVKAVVNIPLGCNLFEYTSSILDICINLGLNFTLLGYKQTEANSSVFPFPYKEELVNYLRDNTIYYFGCDSVVVEEIGNELKEMGVSSKFMILEEGIESMYVDAVSKTYAQSSYYENEKPFPIRVMRTSPFKEVFSKFPFNS